MITVEKMLRNIAKSNKYQTIYCNEKQIGLKLFRNDYDFTDLQLMFLNYLAFYYSLRLDYALGEVDEIVFNNDIYEDSYVYHKNKLREKQNSRFPEIKEDNNINKTQWIFKKK